MTTPSAGYRAKPVIRQTPIVAEKPHGEQRDVHGWKCTCGADQGQTVLAIEDDAQNAADLHTRTAHPGTFLADLTGLARRGEIKSGIRVLGDKVTYVQPVAAGGTYFETAAGGRFRFADGDGTEVLAYTDASTRPE